MTIPAKRNWKIFQGATFRKLQRWRAGGFAVDFTGCTARMQVRSEVESPTVLLELTTENGGITLGGIDGTVALYVSATETAAIGWESGVFDMEIEWPGGDVSRIVQGSISVSPEVTRA